LEDFLNKFQCLLVAGVLAAFVAASPSSAQTPVNITVISGNGQMTCQLCAGINPFFDKMFVKVTDANGNPVSGATVNWSLTSGSGNLGNSALTDQVVTDSNGLASESFIAPNQITGSITNPWVQSTITASLSNGPSVVFYETQAFANLSGNGNSNQLVQVAFLTPSSFPPCASCIFPGDTLNGTAGSTATAQFKVQVYAQGTTLPAVPNVSLRLVPNQTSPSISCATAAGADPGSVLTDSNGTAVCTAIIGPTTGAGQFSALVGGVASFGYNQGGAPVGYALQGPYNLNVLPGLPGSLQIVSGNNLSATPGQQVPGSLVAAVLDAAGNPLSNQQVVWTVSPSNSATLSATTTTSDANGRVQTNATLTSSASGQISVKVALANNPNISATFTITANVLITGLQIVSGNNQTALVNQSFQSPLVVQLSSSNGPASGIPVNFSITGPAVLSTGAATTGANGQASVQVLAGGTTGAVTVTATSGTFSTAFSLTVIPNGPSLNTNSFFNGADFQPGAISPCGIATIIAPGIAPAIQGTIAYDGVGALPYTLGGVQVTFSGAQAPIYNVANMNGQQQVTVQVPCSVVPGNVPVVVSVGGGTGTITIPVWPASPGLFLTQFNSTTQIPVLVRPDGSFVSPTNPAHRGETLIAYLTGMGPNTPALATNALPAPGSSPTFQGTIIIGMNGGGVPMVAATVSPDLIGVETVSFVVPTATQSGNSTFSVGVIPSGSSTAYYSTLGLFPVQ
jgi:uncharacterized protein (TIGR03437 family)